MASQTTTDLGVNVTDVSAREKGREIEIEIDATEIGTG